MGDQYRLLGLGNSELLAGLSSLVQQGNALTAQMLAHLVELEQRWLHLELGFSSLFSYCVEALCMSEGAAGRRVAAARVCRRFPEAFERVARGDLHLCALCALAPHLTVETASELFETCRGKSRRQIEELLAMRFPRPDVREQIRRVPTRAQVPAVTAQALKRAAAVEAPAAPTPQQNASDLENSRTLPAGITAPERSRRTRESEPLSADRFGVHFTADTELRDLIERARALASHRIPNGDLAGLMKLMVASFVRQEEKRRFGIGTRPRRSKETKPSRTPESMTPPGEAPVAPGASEHQIRAQRTTPSRRYRRYVALQVRREVHVRDSGQCSFVSSDGRRCGARALLELDHVKPLAELGGGDTLNMRLLCKAHNLLHARKCFGARHIAAKIAAKGRSLSAPPSR